MIAFIKLPLFGSFSYPIKCVKEGNRAKNSCSSHHQSTWDGGKSLNMGDQLRSGWKIICVNLPLTVLFTLAYLNLFLFLYLWRCVSQPIFFFAILFVVLSYCGSQKWKKKMKTVRALTGVLRQIFPGRFKMLFFLNLPLSFLPHTM